MNNDLLYSNKMNKMTTFIYGIICCHSVALEKTRSSMCKLYNFKDRLRKQAIRGWTEQKTLKWQDMHALAPRGQETKLISSPWNLEFTQIATKQIPVFCTCLVIQKCLCHLVFELLYVFSFVYYFCFLFMGEGMISQQVSQVLEDN